MSSGHGDTHFMMQNFGFFNQIFHVSFFFLLKMAKGNLTASLISFLALRLNGKHWKSRVGTPFKVNYICSLTNSFLVELILTGPNFGLECSSYIFEVRPISRGLLLQTPQHAILLGHPKDLVACVFGEMPKGNLNPWVGSTEPSDF